MLTPAAYTLPRKWALALAYVLALSLLILPIPGLHTYRGMRRAFGKNRADSLYLAWGWLTRPLYDYVILKRLIYGREDPFRWRIVERNADYINSLRATGESYIIAVAHYAKVPSLCMLSPNVTCGQSVLVGGNPRKRVTSLYDLRIYIQGGAFIGAQSSCWERTPEFVWVGKDLRGAKKIYNRLCERGNVVSIAVDALWHKTLTGSYERPFAGQKSRIFATGAAELARLAQCPIISCVHILESDGTIVLEWGKPIRIIDYEMATVIDVMNKLLDTFEVAIGERPTQYLYEIGRDRLWNSKSKRWEDLGN